MAAWKQAGFRVVGHLVFTKSYASKAAFVGYRHECAYLLARAAQGAWSAAAGCAALGVLRQSPSPDRKARRFITAAD